VKSIEDIKDERRKVAGIRILRHLYGYSRLEKEKLAYLRNIRPMM
jgi:hypothetical protein